MSERVDPLSTLDNTDVTEKILDVIDTEGIDGRIAVRSLWTSGRLRKFSGEQVREGISDLMTHQRLTLGNVATEYVRQSYELNNQ